MDILSTWQLNLVGYYICIVAFFVFYKKGINASANDGPATIIFQIFAGLTGLLVSPLFGFDWPSIASPWLLLSLACVFYALNDRIQATVRRELDLSVFAVIGQLTTVFLVIASVTVLGGEPSVTKILGAAVIVLANIALLAKSFRIFDNFGKAHYLAILAALIFAGAMTIDIGLVDEFNVGFYVAFTFLIPALMISLAEKISPNKLLSEFKTGSGRDFVLTGIFWAGTVVFALRSFKFGDERVLIPLQAVAVLMHVFAGYVFLSERSDLLRKSVAAVGVVAGVVLTVS